MISLGTAQELVLQQAGSFGREIILLEEATGRVLNEPLIADRDYPPFNRATMDGIAVNSADWQEGVRTFTAVETIFAGTVPLAQLGKADCYRIMTGAAVPTGADTVIRIEDVAADQNRLTVTVSNIEAGQNIAPAGSDTRKDTILISKPVLIKPGTITSLASLGYAEVKVATLPAVAIITTGDEVVPVEGAVSGLQVRNSNASLLQSLLSAWKIAPAICRHVKDDPAALYSAIAQQQQRQVLIVSGAVSAGEADHVPSMLLKAGAKEIFHKVAIRPGKPFWFGRFEKGPVVFALPGNPFSTFATFKLFIEPYLRSCFGVAPAPLPHFHLLKQRDKKNDLTEFFPVRFADEPGHVEAIPFNTSGDITAVMHADALAMQAAGKKSIGAGEFVPCILL